ncbi:uncharacterized protein METZ01_LOCUS43454, partial [marine metagenome]
MKYALHRLACLWIVVILLPIGCASSRLLRYHDIPVPGGSYVVGTRVFEWTDSSRTDIFADKEDALRRIMVQFWYPAVKRNSGERFIYFQNNKMIVNELANHYSVPKFLLAGVIEIETNSFIDLEPSTNKGSYPLVVFSHGRGGYKHQNSIQCEELASRGYVVVAVGHTYDSFITIFSDGSTAPYLSEKSRKAGEAAKPKITTEQKLDLRVGDIQFVLDQIDHLQGKNPLFGIIDLERVGMFGQSFGGATTIATASTDNRIDAAAGFDTWFIPLSDKIIQEGMSIPFLHLGQDKWERMPENYKKMKTLMKNSSAPNHHFAASRMKHYDFTDGPQYAPAAKVVVPYFSWEDRSTMRAMLNTMVTVFFDSHLKRK